MDKNGDFKESSKDKLNRAIASMCDEWLLIEEIDLEADTFEILHDNLQKQGIPVHGIVVTASRISRCRSWLHQNIRNIVIISVCGIICASF